MKNKELYSRYRERLQFLEDSATKVSFERFLEIARPPTRQFEILESYYKSAKTYRDFFKNIPFEDRCMILLPWLENFIMYYLQDNYSNLGWEINILDITKKIGGQKRNKTRKNKNRLYPDNYKIINHISYSLV